MKESRQASESICVSFVLLSSQDALSCVIGSTIGIVSWAASEAARPAH